MDYLANIMALVAALSERQSCTLTYDARTGSWSAVLDTQGEVVAGDLTSLSKMLEGALQAEKEARIAALELKRTHLADCIAMLGAV